MRTLTAPRRGAVPAWARRQRELFAAIDAAAPLFLRKYVHPGGTLKEHGKLDDDYECFNSWPLVYAMGGRPELLEWSLNAWNGITRQWTYPPRCAVRREFVRHSDALHLSEAYTGFQAFGLAAPQIPENAARALRFASFYLGDEPSARNYDPRLRLIRSPITGSGGPLFESSADYVLNYVFASLYPVVRELEAGWDRDPARHAEIQRLYNAMVMQGDVPMNLAITGLVAHAHILTGDARCRAWVLEYVDAWIERARRNGGLIPDNVGLDDRIGQTRGGNWWGGFFGWNGRYSVWMIFHALITATECAYLLSRDRTYLEFYRSQVDFLLERATERDGDLLVPYKHDRDGWYDYRPLDPYIVGHLWHLSMDAADEARLRRLHAGAAHGPHAYAYAESPDPPAPGAEAWRPAGPADWDHVRDDLYGNKFVENEPAHLRFLLGANPGWPAAILAATERQVATAVERLQGDSYQHPWRSQTMQAQNPVLGAALGQMTMGAPFPCYNGGLLMARLRYFDADAGRPGLPPDVAALVERLAADHTVVELVNTSAAHRRQVIVQAGAYAEHCVEQVSAAPLAGAEPAVASPPPLRVDGTWFEVELPPATGVRLSLAMRCFVRPPTYAWPPDRGGCAAPGLSRPAAP